MAWNPSLSAYQAGAVAARFAPEPVRAAAVAALTRVAMPATPERCAVVAQNVRRVLGRPLGSAEERRLVRASFESYGRYWAESFRLPTMGRAELEARFAYEGFDHIQRARADGFGPLVVIPHLGGWEMAAFWLTRVADVPVTAVVEPLDPPELFEWFVSFREALGMRVVPLGPDAAAEVSAAVRRRDVICLLSDRDIAGNGTEVAFFGETTTLPSGPALLGLRTGAPLIPCGVYFDGPRCRAVVKPPLESERRGRLREDVARITQNVAVAMEDLIRPAPEQWHLMEPNWPADRIGSP